MNLIPQNDLRHIKAYSLGGTSLKKRRKIKRPTIFTSKSDSKTGYTVAINPRHLPEAKLNLEKTLIEAANLLIKGKPKEIYQLQVQAFPLSNRKI